MRKKPAQGRARDRHASHGDDDSSSYADDQDHGSRYKEDRESGAQIGLFHNQQHGRDRQKKRHQKLFEADGSFLAARAEVPGEHENDRQTREFRGLQAQGPQNEPALRASEHLAR